MLQTQQTVLSQTINTRKTYVTILEYDIMNDIIDINSNNSNNIAALQVCQISYYQKNKVFCILCIYETEYDVYIRASWMRFVFKRNADTTPLAHPHLEPALRYSLLYSRFVRYKTAPCWSTLLFMYARNPGEILGHRLFAERDIRRHYHIINTTVALFSNVLLCTLHESKRPRRVLRY